MNLRERPSSREQTPDAAETDDISGNDAASEVSSSGLPPPLISASEYDTLICGSCVLKNSTIRKWAGTPYAMMVIRDNEHAPWKVLKSETEDNNAEVVIDDTEASTFPPERSGGIKRAHESISGETEDIRAKRIRVESAESDQESHTTCTAPGSSQVAQNIFQALIPGTFEVALGAGDVFLAENWRERWCRCPQVSYIS